MSLIYKYRIGKEIGMNIIVYENCGRVVFVAMEEMALLCRVLNGVFSPAGDDADADPAVDPQQFVRRMVQRNPCVIFSKTTCPYATTAKDILLRRLKAKCRVVEIDRMPAGRKVQNELANLTGRTTVPNVFVGGTSIGGGDDTDDLHRAGMLEGILRAAGAL